MTGGPGLWKSGYSFRGTGRGLGRHWINTHAHIPLCGHTGRPKLTMNLETAAVCRSVVGNNFSKKPYSTAWLGGWHKS